MARKLFILLMVLLVVALPLSAQGQGNKNKDDDAPVFEITGVFTIDGDDLFVDGIELAPTDVFKPSDFADGDMVLVTGYLTEDDTLQVLTFELAPDEEAATEADNSDADTGDDEEEADNGKGKGNNGNRGNNDNDDADTEDDDNGNGRGNNNGNNGDRGNNGNNGNNNNDNANNSNRSNDNDNADNANENAEDNGSDNIHPIAEILAAEFGMSVEDIMALNEDGVGYGNISRALLIADAVGIGVADVLADLDAYDGSWGELKKAYMEQYDLSPSDLAPGRTISNNRGNRPDDVGEGNNNGKGNND